MNTQDVGRSLIEFARLPSLAAGSMAVNLAAQEEIVRRRREAVERARERAWQRFVEATHRAQLKAFYRRHPIALKKTSGRVRRRKEREQ